MPPVGEIIQLATSVCELPRQALPTSAAHHAMQMSMEVAMLENRAVAAKSREGFIEQEFHSGGDPRRDSTTQPTVPDAPIMPDIAPDDVIAFWREAGPSLWFTQDADFDRRFRESFLHAHEAATRGALDRWLATPTGALALILLLDQFPRNAFRGTPRMYASDAHARAVADTAIAVGHDRQVAPELRVFVYLPLGHSENIADQNRCVALSRPLGEPDAGHAEGHRDIIRRFGRFPHRNPILGRAMTAEEQHFLDQGGYAG
jgi:uncharacterized protein (DUF924 family)